MAEGEGAGKEGTRRCPRCGKSFGDDVSRCPSDGTALVSTSQADPLVGLEVDGRYTLKAPLGQGGMGRVYRAYQHSIGRDVAFKVMNAGVQDEASRRRFIREAQLLGQLNHPGIVAAVDFGELPDRSLFLVMELLEGQSLSQLVRSEGPLSEARVVEIGRQICDALSAAHHRGIVHRDLKPSNVMRLAGPPGSRDVVKVLDFGLARPVNDVDHLTESGVVLGSAQFMAPELMDGVEARPASDLYSLGAILYVLANGRLPFGAGQGFTAAAQRQARGQLEPFESFVTPAMQQLIRRLLAIEPSARPASAELVREMLSAVLELPPTEPSRSKRAKPSASLVVGLFAVAGLALGVGGTWWSKSRVAMEQGVAAERESAREIGSGVAAEREPARATEQGVAAEREPSKAGGSELTAAAERSPTDTAAVGRAPGNVPTGNAPPDAGISKLTKRATTKKRGEKSVSGKSTDGGLIGDWLP